MELEQLERHRIRIYKEHLRRDIELRNQRNSAQKADQMHRDNQQVNYVMNRVKQQDYQKKMEKRKIANSLVEDNRLIKHMQSTNFQYQSPEQIVESSAMQPNQKSFTQQIYEADKVRLTKLKHQLNQHRNDQLLQERNRKLYNERVREWEKGQEQRHVQRVRQDQRKSVQQYNDIIRKHSQDMAAYQRQKRFTDNREREKSGNIQSFEEQEEIFTHIKRNQTDIRKKINLNLQEEVKMQMEEYDQRKYIEKLNHKVSENLEKSMLSSVLMKQPKSHSFYLNDLKNQMNERGTKESKQKIERKEKVYMNNIFGGRPTRERYEQLEYVDRKLGFQNEPLVLARASPMGEQRYSKGGIPYKYSNNGIQLQRAPVADSRMRLNRSQQELPQSHKSQQLQQSRPKHAYPTDPAAYRGQGLDLKEYRLPVEKRKDEGSEQSQRSKKSYLSYDVISGTNRYYEPTIHK